VQQFRVEVLEIFPQDPQGVHGTDVLDGELEFAFVRTHQALDPHVVARGEGPGAPGQNVAPDPGHHAAAFVTQDQGEEGFAGFVGAALHLAHQEKLLHLGAFLEFGDELVGHD
jgi:hypothetical protein